MLFHQIFRHCFNKSLRPRRSSAISVEALEYRRVPAVVNPYVAVTPTIDFTANKWTADNTGKYQTANLASEWQADYQAMQNPIMPIILRQHRNSLRVARSRSINPQRTVKLSRLGGLSRRR